MFYIYNNLFADEKCENKFDEICDGIINKHFVAGVFCIILSTNSNNLFDIININELRFNFYHNTDIFIIGFAKGKKGAHDLLVKIIEKAAGENKIHNIRDSFNKENFVGIQ